MKNEFTTYKQALALKELGFEHVQFSYRDGYYTILCESPTFSQTFRWFRYKHGLIGQPIPLSISYPGKVTHYGWSIVNNQNSNDWENEDDGFETYEEAESSCLNKLIEICKTKIND